MCSATGIITGNAVNEFKENAMLAGIHPWLFYNGRGMQKDINRKIQYSRQQWINLWAYQHNRKFAHDFSFLFNVKDMYDRHDSYSRARIHIRPSHLVTAAQRTPQKLKEIATFLAEGMEFNDIIKRYPQMLHIIRSISVSGKYISGSPFERSEFKKPMRALTTSDGTASLWVTINLSDVSSPQLALFTGESITNISLQNKSQRWIMIARDAFACVVWFDFFLKKLINLLLGFKPLSCARGLLGNAINHAGCKEGTQRGSTHFHDKLTIKEFIFIRKILKDIKLRKILEPFIRDFVDTMLSNSIYGIRNNGIMSNFVEGNNVELEETVLKDQDGHDYASKTMGILPINENLKDEPAFGKMYNNRVKTKLNKKMINDPEVKLFMRINALAQTRQMHGKRRIDKDGMYIGRICNATCVKTRKSLLRSNCRFSFGEDGKDILKKSFIDNEGNINVARNNSHIVTYSPAILALVGSNICFNIIKTGRDGLAMDMYLTNYSTKSALTTGRLFSILASDKRKEPDYACSDSIKSFKKITARWLNLLMGSIDHSQQHVAICLSNIDREVISHRTFQIYTGRFYQMLNSDEELINNNIGSYILEKSGNGQLRLSCFAEDYALRTDIINNNVGCLSVISFAENVFKKKDLSGYRLNSEHPQYVTHSFKFKIKPFKINLLGPLFLSNKNKREKPEEYAKCILLFFKPWLKTPNILKTHISWSHSLKAWSFEDRYNIDDRWYLKIDENIIIPTHPFIENINDMFEGKDLAMRQKLKSLNSINQDGHFDNSEQDLNINIDNNCIHDKSESLPLYVNQSNIIYLSNNNIRKLKIAEHIQMVTNDILEAFRPCVNNSECILPEEYNFDTELLNIINDSWKNCSKNKDTVDKKTANMLTILPEDHPFRNLLFDYETKKDEKIWNDIHEKKRMIIQIS